MNSKTSIMDNSVSSLSSKLAFFEQNIKKSSDSESNVFLTNIASKRTSATVTRRSMKTDGGKLKVFGHHSSPTLFSEPDYSISHFTSSVSTMSVTSFSEDDTIQSLSDSFPRQIHLVENPKTYQLPESKSPVVSGMDTFKDSASRFLSSAETGNERGSPVSPCHPKKSSLRPGIVRGYSFEPEDDDSESSFLYGTFINSNDHSAVSNDNRIRPSLMRGFSFE